MSFEKRRTGADGIGLPEESGLGANVVALSKPAGPGEPPHMDHQSLLELLAVFSDLVRLRDLADGEVGPIVERLARLIERHEPPKGAA